MPALWISHSKLRGKGHLINIFSSASHAVSVTAPLCHHSVKGPQITRLRLGPGPTLQHAGLQASPGVHIPALWAPSTPTPAPPQVRPVACFLIRWFSHLEAQMLQGPVSGSHTLSTTVLSYLSRVSFPTPYPMPLLCVLLCPPRPHTALQLSA